MGDRKNEVTPSDEFADYLVSCAVNLLCAAQTWRLRIRAAGCQSPPGGVELIFVNYVNREK